MSSLTIRGRWFARTNVETDLSKALAKFPSVQSIDDAFVAPLPPRDMADGERYRAEVTRFDQVINDAHEATMHVLASEEHRLDRIDDKAKALLTAASGTTTAVLGFAAALFTAKPELLLRASMRPVLVTALVIVAFGLASLTFAFRALHVEKSGSSMSGDTIIHRDVVALATATTAGEYRLLLIKQAWWVAKAIFTAHQSKAKQVKRGQLALIGQVLLLALAVLVGTVFAIAHAH